MVDFAFVCVLRCPHRWWEPGDTIGWAPGDVLHSVTVLGGESYPCSHLSYLWDDFLAGRVRVNNATDRAKNAMARSSAYKVTAGSDEDAIQVLLNSLDREPPPA